MGHLIARSSQEGDFLQVDNGTLDHNLFGLSFGPVMAALSYIFDKSGDQDLIEAGVSGQARKRGRWLAGLMTKVLKKKNLK